jgi:LysR family transcriptional regulator, benzoate and cis,cis-muconate-responsive activator of ben and cat genes
MADTPKIDGVEPEDRLLRYFLAVAEELNFTRAAERLGIAQPALSAQIRRLEAQLGVQLLQRTTRSVQVTDAGRIVQEQGPAALAALGEVWEAARRAGRGEAGRLRVAYSPSAGYETAPTLVGAVRERYPAIEVVTEVLDAPDIVRAVQDGRSHVGIARTPAPAAGVRLRTVRLERVGVLVAIDHPLAAHAEVALEDVAAHPILMHPRAANPAQFDFVADLFRRAGLEPGFVERAVAFDPTQRTIREGHALGLVGASSADGLAADLRWVPLADADVRLSVELVLPAQDAAPVVDRFERIAVATAAAAGWLT